MRQEARSPAHCPALPAALGQEPCARSMGCGSWSTRRKGRRKEADPHCSLSPSAQAQIYALSTAVLRTQAPAAGGVSRKPWPQPPGRLPAAAWLLCHGCLSATSPLLCPRQAKGKGMCTCFLVVVVFKWKRDKKPLNCHVSKKGGSPLSISAGNCFQPGCGNTTLCQEVVLDDTLKLPPFLLALQQSHCTLLEEQNLQPSQDQKHRRV